MSEFNRRLFNITVHFSVFVFSSLLIYFAFVYYPSTLNKYKNVLPAKSAIAPAVVAKSNDFPIETSSFKIVYEQSTDTYIVFVKGSKLDSFLLNKNAAELTLKNSLSMDNICSLKINFRPVSKLPIGVQTVSGC